MSPRDRKLLRKRRQEIRKEIHEARKAGRNDDVMQLSLSLRQVKKWLSEGPPPIPTCKEVANPDTFDKNLEEPMTKAEFDKQVQDILGDNTTGPKKSIIIHTRKMLDSVWPWIKHLDIEVRAPREVQQYFKEKLNKERLYE